MKLITTAILTLFLTSIFGQDMKVNFSDKMTLKLNKDGFVSRFIGETETNIYVEFQSRNKKQEVVINRIGVFDKATMKEVNSLVIADKKDKARSADLGNKLKEQIKFIDDKIYIFYHQPTDHLQYMLSVFHLGIKFDAYD